MINLEGFPFANHGQALNLVVIYQFKWKAIMRNLILHLETGFHDRILFNHIARWYQM